MLPKFRETKRQGGRCRLCEDQDSAGFEKKRSERQKEGPNAGAPGSGPRADTTLSTREAGEEEAPRAERREKGAVSESECVRTSVQP